MLRVNKILEDKWNTFKKKDTQLLFFNRWQNLSFHMNQKFEKQVLWTEATETSFFSFSLAAPVSVCCTLVETTRELCIGEIITGKYKLKYSKKNLVLVCSFEIPCAISADLMQASVLYSWHLPSCTMTKPDYPHPFMRKNIKPHKKEVLCLQKLLGLQTSCITQKN